MKQAMHYLSIAAACLIVLGAAHGMRQFYGGGMMGDESHYYARVAELLKSGSYWDSLSYGGTTVPLDPYAHLLAAAGFIMPIAYASVFIPLLLGLSVALLLYHILRRLGIRERESLVASVMLVISPIFVSLFAMSRPQGLALFLLLSGAVLFITRFWYLSLVPLSVICFIGPMHALIAAIALLALGLRVNRKGAYVVVSAILLGIIAVQLIPNTSVGFVDGSGSFTREFLSVFGGDYGFSVFAIFLCVAGIAPCWKYRRYFIYPMSAVLLFSYLFGSELNIYLNLAVCGLAAYGFRALIERRWELRLVRDLSIFVLALGMLFVLVSHIHKLASDPPTQEMIDVLAWLARNSEPGAVVLSSQANGFWIEYYAGRPVVLDNRAVPGAQGRFNDTKALFATRNLAEAVSILERYDVRFILVDPKTRQMMVNDRLQEGLVFVLSNSERFKKAEQYSGIEIWEFFR